jgi:hypothetical protein
LQSGDETVHMDFEEARFLICAIQAQSPLCANWAFNAAISAFGRAACAP